MDARKLAVDLAVERLAALIGSGDEDAMKWLRAKVEAEVAPPSIGVSFPPGVRERGPSLPPIMMPGTVLDRGEQPLPNGLPPVVRCTGR